MADSSLTEYLNADMLKVSLGIEKDSTRHDDKIREIVIESNQELDMQLKPFAGQLPFPEGSMQYGQVRKVALHYALQIWYRFFRQFELAKQEGEQYEKKLEMLKQTFAADKTDRTETILVSHDPRDDRLIIPSQVDTVVFDF